MKIRHADERGFFDHGWLKTYHTFSFSGYQDAAHMRFRSLRVMNEDWVAAGQGFGTHPHHDREIVTYVLSGALEHRDSLGNGEVLKPGEFQRMTAGTGITHSEFNPSTTEPVHLYQIWLFPDTTGLTPSYEQKPFAATLRNNRWQLVASPDADEGSLKIHQQARIYLADLTEGIPLEYHMNTGRGLWLQVLKGEITVEDMQARAGDGIAIEDREQITLQTDSSAEVMLFDLA